ncbi:hypothetical protein ABZ631_21855, partial [Nocardiopsis alba]|uniref:hypothetical protein n=1 Tax=Nocardiopsis alba TaxID=53437 RepID=UPI0033F324C6
MGLTIVFFQCLRVFNQADLARCPYLARYGFYEGFVFFSEFIHSINFWASFQDSVGPEGDLG